MLFLLFVALFGFASLANGKIEPQICIAYFILSTGKSCSNPGSYSGKVVCDQLSKLTFLIFID